MPLGALGQLLVLGAVWGASFLFIKVGVTDLRPMTFAMLRVLVGSVALLAVVALRRDRLPRDGRTWGHFAVMGAAGILIPFAAIAWGTQYIASGLSAILNATMPLFTFVLVVALGDEPLRPRRMAGLLVGFVGIIVLMLPKLQTGMRSELWGELAIVVAAVSYAVGIVYARRKLSHLPPLITSLGQVSMGCLMFIPLALAETPWTLTFTPRSIGAILAIGLLGTSLAYIIYYRLLRRVGATATSLVTYISPLFGIFWGWLLLHEALSWHAFAALGLIFAGLLLVNGLPQRRRNGAA